MIQTQRHTEHARIGIRKCIMKKKTRSRNTSTIKDDGIMKDRQHREAI
jgi:hypothetical protein